MTLAAPVRSIDALGDRLGPLAERHFDIALRCLLREPEGVVEPDFARLLTREPHPFGNFVAPAQNISPSSLAAALRPLVDSSAPSAVVWASGSLDDEHASVLERHGYALAETMPAMAIDLDALADAPAPRGAELRRTTPDDARQWAEVFAQGYELPFAVARQFSPLGFETDASPGATMQFFAAVRDGSMVSTSMALMAEGVAGVYCISTPPEHRRQGLGAWITAETLRVAQRLGYGVGVLQASASGDPVYRRLGFRQVGGVPVFIREIVEPETRDT